MRRSTEKKAKFENEAQEPSAKKKRSDNRIRNMDNDTTVEVFKYLTYCGLAKTSLVSKQFCDLIRNDRHKLALLDVQSISMHEHTGINSITGMKIFDKVLSAEEYNEWVIRNGYSKQIPLKIQTQMEGQITGMEGTQYARKVYWLSSHAYEGSTPFSLKELQIFHATIELSHENWPVFQHFFRLLTDPFVHIRHMRLPSQNDALNLLASAITPDFGRLKCHSLRIMPGDNMQNVTSWIKGHVHCDKIDIENYYGLPKDNELVDFFMTGANCTSKIEVNFCDPCKAIGDLIQKFIDLKSGGEDKVVESIECKNFECGELDALIRAHADFVVEENVNQTIGVSNHVFDFVNNDIGKKLRLTIIRQYHGYCPEFKWKFQICNAL